MSLQLPAHFHREQRQLEAAQISSWQQLAELDDQALRSLGQIGRAHV